MYTSKMNIKTKLSAYNMIEGKITITDLRERKQHEGTKTDGIIEHTQKTLD